MCHESAAVDLPQPRIASKMVDISVHRHFHIREFAITIGVEGGSRPGLCAHMERGGQVMDFILGLPEVDGLDGPEIRARWLGLMEMLLPRINAQWVETMLEQGGAFDRFDQLSNTKLDA